MTRLIQIAKGHEREVALVEEPRLRLLDHTSSIYSLAQEADRERRKVDRARAKETLKLTRSTTTPSTKANPIGASCSRSIIPKIQPAAWFPARA